VTTGVTLNNTTILLTGGTGSFGHAFCREVLANHSPHAIRIFSRDEKKQYDMRCEFGDDPRLRWLIGDVRDRERVIRAATGVDVIVHAAALKRIEVCEYSPDEAAKTNINGTTNVADAAIANHVPRAILLSSDKATVPVTLYGETKAVGESMWVYFNGYATHSGAHLSVVRYGNVLGSRGSVVEIWAKQREAGSIQITDPSMTRFWITLPDAVRFVIDRLGDMTGGEIFVPQLKSMKLADLAEAIAPNAEHEIVGLRAYERSYEVLITEEEAAHTLDMGDYYLIQPVSPYWGRQDTSGKRVPENWSYRSDTNTEWLDVETMRDLLTTVGVTV